MSFKADRGPRHPLTWIWLGVVAMSGAAVAAFWLGTDMAGPVVAAAVLIFLSMIGAMVWMDRRDARLTDKASRQE